MPICTVLIVSQHGLDGLPEQLRVERLSDVVVAAKIDSVLEIRLLRCRGQT